MDQKILARRIVLLTIKYAPAVMTLTCCAKIALLTMSKTYKAPYLFAVNWINWVMNVLAVVFCYAAGRYFGYCWKHRSLCRTAMWGYMYYAVFLIVRPSHEAVMPIVWMYVALVVVFTILYKEL